MKSYRREREGVEEKERELKRKRSYRRERRAAGFNSFRYSLV